MIRRCTVLPLVLAIPALCSSAHLALADKWTQPTPEELSMTTQPEVPGAPAVYLMREEVTEDKLHMYSVYVRLKVLNERGKEFANVELRYPSGHGTQMSMGEIAGRTIEPDGTVVPFTGKPYEKLIEKDRDHKYMAKVFTMPDVRVGSILEYRYVARWDDHYFIAPNWYVQSEFFTRKAHYIWKPTSEQLLTNDERGQLTAGISWTPVLPSGTEVKLTQMPQQNAFDPGQRIFELTMQNIPPTPEEEHMPPIGSFTYRVLFYYTPYRNQNEFWSKEGKYWSKREDRFIGPGPAVVSAVHELVQPADTSDQKLRKLYTAAQKLDNTAYSRSRSSSEEKAQGFGEVKTSDDIWTRRRGDANQIAEVFAAMARAAGFRAYLMAVTNRDRSLFFPPFLSLSQLDDFIVAVSVDGKEVYFDPGTPFVPYGQLAWKHDESGGLKQVDGGGAVIAYTPGSSYTASRIQRIANLTMTADGTVHGTVRMTYIGMPAIAWRQLSLANDEGDLKHELTETAERSLPGGMTVHLTSVEKLNETEQPLTVIFDVSGRIGSSTGKRLLLPCDLFESNEQPMFPHEKRSIAVYFDYAHMQQDAIRINFPSAFTMESMPEPTKMQYQKTVAYDLTTEATPTSVTIRRDYLLGDIIFQPRDYPELRTFFGNFEGKDQQGIVLKQPATAAQAANSGAPL